MVAAGVSEQTGTAALHYLPGRRGQGSLGSSNASRSVWKAHDSDITTAEVELITGAWITTLHPPEWAIIKIDVEGHERSVLAGITNLQWRHLLTEVSPGHGGVDDEADLECLLAEQGFEIEALTVIERSATG